MFDYEQEPHQKNTHFINQSKILAPFIIMIWTNKFRVWLIVYDHQNRSC